MSSIHKWFTTDPGGLYLVQEVALLKTILAKLRGLHILQMGVDDCPDIAEMSPQPHKWLLAQRLVSHPDVSSIVGDYERLPLPSQSVHVSLLLHVLEQSTEPLACLQEVDRVLLPEGHLVVTGFNACSLWRLLRLLPRRAGKFSLSRLKRWGREHGYLLHTTHRFYFRPPVRSLRLTRFFSSFESFSRWLLPWGGVAYAIVLKKRELPLTPVRGQWQKTRSVLSGRLPEPTSRSYRS